MVSPKQARAAAAGRPQAQPAAPAATPKPPVPRKPAKGAAKAKAPRPGRPPARARDDAEHRAETRVAAPPDALDKLVAAGPLRAIALMLWLDRYRNPEFAVQIKPEDIKAFDACTGYLEVKPGTSVEPRVLIRRPMGQPAYPGIPPGTNKRFPDGIAPRAAEPPRDYVLVSLVDQEGNGIKPIESTEEGARRRDRENELRGLRERAPILAMAVASNANANTFNSSEITDLCNLAIQLARA